MLVKRMDLAWVTVSDFAKAKKLFVDTLGLKVRSAAEEWGWIELVGPEGGAALGIALVGNKADCQKDSPIKPGNHAVVTMLVDNIEAARDEIVAKGVTCVGDIQTVPGHVKLQLFSDTDGNLFQLVEALDKKA